MTIFKKKLTVYPTYGYRAEGDEGGAWRIPMRAWVRNEQPLPPDSVIRLCADDEGALTENMLLRLKECARDFVAIDNEGEEVRLRFDGDPAGQTYTLRGKTDDNGVLIDDAFTLDAERARAILAAQGSGAHGRLTFTAETSGWSGGAQAVSGVQLIPSEGLSVVSDIDDTIKVSEIPAGKRTAFRRAFLMDYEETKEMRNRYLKLLERHPLFDNVAFHYVSGGPWQLFRMLHDYLITTTGFPAGSFHMKSVNINLKDFAASFRDINRVRLGKEETKKQKLADISPIIERFPRRKFILIGDSGELDPEVFGELKLKFPDRVLKIYIRDVTELGEKHERLKDMLRIDTHGVCLQDDGE